MNELKQPSIYGVSHKELKAFLNEHDLSPHLAHSIFEELYKKKLSQTISKITWDTLKKYFSLELPAISLIQKSGDGTIKFLLKFTDGKKVEAVLIPFHKRYTICLSSQVGCAMNCSFCFTGTMGLSRHLKAFEITGQYLVLKKYLEENISKEAFSPNIVFMGQGEPLHNFEEVQKAISLFLDRKAYALGPRQITLSTAGFIPGLKKFNLLPPINLAVSLHSAFNDQRTKLIPINAQYPLEQLFAILDEIKLMKRQFITYEYLLIDNLNDRAEDAKALQTLLGHRRALINIIPFNPYPGGDYQRPKEDKIQNFKEMLVEKKLRVFLRTTKGDEILAACGQLNS